MKIGDLISLNKPALLHTSKIKELRAAIHGKCRHLPSSRLDFIIEKIDPARRYFIKATRCPQKFLNIISSENIVTEEMHVLSETTLIYGSFTPGRFTNLHGVKTIISGNLDACAPAAALKSSYGNRFFTSGTISYTLVIYEP